MDKNASKLKLKKRRYFSENFKKQKVQEIVTKKASIREISDLYNIATKVLYDWLHKYSSSHPKDVKIVYEMESDSQKALFYKEQVAELERIVGQKQIEIEFLNKLLELASKELDMDLKKSFSTKLSNGTDKTFRKPLLP
jgi:transposase-like protein